MPKHPAAAACPHQSIIGLNPPFPRASRERPRGRAISDTLIRVTDPALHPALVLCTAAQLDLARAIARAARLNILGVAPAEPAAGSGAFAEAAAELPVLDEFRAALAKAQGGLVLLLSPPVGFSIDAAQLESARDRGVRLASLEPMPASVLDLQDPTLSPAEPMDAGVVLGPGTGPAPASDGSPAFTPQATFCPLWRVSHPVRSLAEVVAQLGTIRTLLVESLAGAGEGSLGARLFDACDAAVWLMGQPDRVDAAYSPALRSRGVHVAPPQSLAGLSGDMTANLRYADGRCAAIVASDRAGRWSRCVTLLGENGRLKVFDDGFVWFSLAGAIVDASRDESRIRGGAAADPPHRAAASAIADQLARLLDPHIPAPPPSDDVGVLATAGAALLSARTGEGESPSTLRRMARAG